MGFLGFHGMMHLWDSIWVNRAVHNFVVALAVPTYSEMGISF